MSPTVKFFRMPGNVNPLPIYETANAAGMDIRASRNQTIDDGDWEPVPTGFCIAIPEGYEGQVRPRSGIAARNGVTVLNSPGTIDADYRGELKVILINHSGAQFHIEKGDRIAQLVIAPVAKAELVEVEELDDTERGDKGFGSTGVG